MGHRWIVLLLVAFGVATTASCRKTPAQLRDQHLVQGDEFFQDKHFPQATVEYQKAVTADPQSIEARQRLAESYVRIGMVEFAIKEYGRAADLAPQRADLAMQSASLLLAARRFEEAETYARRAVTQGAALGAAHLLLGNALVGLSSVTDVTVTVALQPSTPEALSRFREAEAEYRTAIALEPDAPSPYVALGRVYEALGRPANAEAEYKRARGLKGGDVLARRALARLYLATSRRQEAEVELKALADAMGTPGAYLELADYYIAMERWSDARSVLEPLLDRVSTFNSARIQLAAVEFRTGRLERAHALIDEVLDPFPHDAKALLFKARLLRYEGKIDEALARARSAVDEDSDSVVARRELASLYVMKHNRDEALRVLRSIASVNEKAEIQTDLARLYLDRSDVTRARSAAERAAALDPASATARSLLVRALVRGGDQSGAEAVLGMIPASDDSADVLIARGDVNAARRLTAAARRFYARSLAAEPDNPDALSAAVRLEIAARRFPAARAWLSSSKAPSSNLVQLGRRLNAEITAAEGHAGDAEHALADLAGDEPGDAETWVALAELRLRLGRLDEARSAAEQAVRRQPAWPKATLVLGAILEGQGKMSEARARYEQLLEQDPDAIEVGQRLRR